MLENLIIKFEDRKKVSFHAGDYGKSNLDLYFAWTGEPQTNPASWWDTVKWGAGNGVEAQLMKILKDSDMVQKDYDQKIHGRVVLTPEYVLQNGKKLGIEVHGYIDAIHVQGWPIEIKSINNKNAQDIYNYESGRPRENYVGQLSTYLEFRNVERGALFVCSVDGLHRYFIECRRVSPGVYQCGDVIVDLYAEWERFRVLKENHVDKGIMPDIWQYRYKFPVREIDYHKLPKSQIVNARANRSVIGDWQLKYSSWKDKIVELQGETLRYTEEELSIIMEKTDKYTTWPEMQPKKRKKKEEDEE